MNRLRIPVFSARGRVRTLWLGLVCVEVLAEALVGVAATPKLKIDGTPLALDARPSFTFRPIYEKVSRSVVNVYSTKTIRENPNIAPFFEDPFFRQFFGGGPFQNVPRERREQALGSGVIEESFSLELGELTKEGLVKADGRSGGLRRSRGTDALDGVTVDDLNARTREQFSIPPGVRGAVVAEVDESSAAAAAGLRQGDVILEITGNG